MDDTSQGQESNSQHFTVQQILDGILTWLAELICWTDEDQEKAGIYPGNQR